MNLNDWAQKIHENAVSHGWWEGERSAETVLHRKTPIRRNGLGLS